MWYQVILIVFICSSCPTVWYQVILIVFICSSCLTMWYQVILIVFICSSCPTMWYQVILIVFICRSCITMWYRVSTWPNTDCVHVICSSCPTMWYRVNTSSWYLWSSLTVHRAALSLCESTCTFSFSLVLCTQTAAEIHYNYHKFYINIVALQVSGVNTNLISPMMSVPHLILVIKYILFCIVKHLI